MKRLRPSVHLAVVSALLIWTLPQHSYADTQSIVALTKTPVFNDSKGFQNSPADLSAHTPTEIPNFTYNSKESDLWERVRAGYAIPDLDNKLVNNQVTWYSTRTEYILRTVQRGSRYLYHVVEELEKRGMPTELALLPFIESAFNPQAISTTKATGMWQFMAATGKDFNLKQNMFKDERRGVLDSTDAALNYLERLHGMFGDWQLALAAYNWGEGSVQRAIKKQQALGLPVDFDSMSALMPPETRNYLPKLQAVKNIIAHPEQFNLALPKLENQPYFVSVDKTRDIDVRVAAQLAELSLDEFNALNPQFNRPVITGSSNTKILLPTDNATLFKENLSKWQGPLSSWSTLSVQKTEKIENLASRIGVKPELLRDVNLIPAKMLVKAGSTILVPKSDKNEDKDIAPELADKAQLVIEKSVTTRQITYKVGKRDNLNSIAKRYQVSIADVRSWNNLKHDSVTTGQTLHLQVPVFNKAARTTVASHGKPAVRAQATMRNSHTIVAHAKTTKKRHG
ncbi:transglycosylase SLT domain-containing protein [Undibacterium sp. Dicai25W]|uniref:transglycosylase SLT domain-containing protein n=1 Tax=Undibacterium sp. Dicai25W TaxID=3413034 RepID=UPI003BF12470